MHDKSEAQSILVSAHSTFLKAVNGEETRYFPYTPTHRIKAYAFDKNADPDTVQGFAVYDTAISSSYAVALYATIAEAQAHKPRQPVKDELFSKMEEIVPTEEGEEAPAEVEPSPDPLPDKRLSKRWGKKP